MFKTIITCSLELFCNENAECMLHERVQNRSENVINSVLCLHHSKMTLFAKTVNSQSVIFVPSK